MPTCSIRLPTCESPLPFPRAAKTGNRGVPTITAPTKSSITAKPTLRLLSSPKMQAMDDKHPTARDPAYHDQPTHLPDEVFGLDSQAIIRLGDVVVGSGLLP